MHATGAQDNRPQSQLIEHSLLFHRYLVLLGRHINQDVTERLISDSQSSVTPNQMGSNACTIIAVYGAVNFLLPSTNWSLLSPQNTTTIHFYKLVIAITTEYHHN